MRSNDVTRIRPYEFRSNSAQGAVYGGIIKALDQLRLTRCCPDRHADSRRVECAYFKTRIRERQPRGSDGELGRAANAVGIQLRYICLTSEILHLGSSMYAV